MANKYKHIDLGYIEKMSQGNKQIIIKMLKSYLISIPGFIKETALTFESGSWHLLGNAAFRAKDIMPIIGLKQLAIDLNELDLLCRKGEDIDSIKNYIDNFSQIGSEAVFEIKAALSEMES